jgi:hypothetical protein
VHDTDPTSSVRIEMPQVNKIAFEQYLAAVISSHVSSEQFDQG